MAKFTEIEKKDLLFNHRIMLEMMKELEVASVTLSEYFVRIEYVNGDVTRVTPNEK